MVSRKEADSLTFPKFGNIGQFRVNWSHARREVVGKSGQPKRICGLWRRAIEEVDKYDVDKLANPGRTFEQYVSKIHTAALNRVSYLLKRTILRVEEELYKKGIDMIGSQSMCMIYHSYH